MSQAGHKALLILPAWSPYRNPCLPLGPASCQRFLFRCSWHQQGAGRAQWCGGGCWGCLCPLRPAQAGRDLQVLAPRGRTSHPSACREIGMVARGCCKGSSWSWRLIWRKKRKMHALKMKKMLRHGVRGCTVWPWPHPPAHSSAPSACLSAAFPGHHFPPARSRVSSWAEAEPPPPYSSHWLQLSPSTGCSSTVPARHGQLRPDDVSRFHKGSWLHIPPGTLLRGQPPSPELGGERPLPRCCLCPYQGPARLLTEIQHPVLLFSRLPVVSKVLAASGLALS